MSDDLRRRVAAITLAVAGLIHLVLVGEYLADQTYLGLLFLIGGVDAVFVGAWLFMDDDPVAWGMGALVAFGMAVGLVLSRTVGLGRFHVDRLEPGGIVALVLEGVFLLLAASRPKERPAPH